jgi:acetylornithine deacetylase
MGIESVILGPGSNQKAHQEDEFVPIDELERSVDLYAEAIRHFCG